ncbi:MAG: sulfotransferase [Nocardioidaceae bacterium]
MSALVPPIGRLIRARDDLQTEVNDVRGELRKARRRNNQNRLARERWTQERTELEKHQQLLNHRLERAERELASHAAASGDLARDDLNYVFIVTYGRTGSTLLQGILSSTPGWLIRGENNDAMYHLYEYHRSGDEKREKHLREEQLSTSSAWFGIDEFPLSASLQHIRALALSTLLRPEPDTRVIGFKEIRWWKHDDLDAYVGFLREVFPGARFIINTRNLEDVARSKWWARRDDPSSDLKRYEEMLMNLHESLGDASFHIAYDDYVNDPDALTPLFDWLGEPLDVDRVRAVMAERHSY